MEAGARPGRRRPSGRPGVKSRQRRRSASPGSPSPQDRAACATPTACWLNDKPFKIEDLEAALGRPVRRLENDANCSRPLRRPTDGAGRRRRGGVRRDPRHRLRRRRRGGAPEGHGRGPQRHRRRVGPHPPALAPTPAGTCRTRTGCWCGRYRNCLETWISGTGLQPGLRRRRHRTGRLNGDGDRGGAPAAARRGRCPRGARPLRRSPGPRAWR